MTVPADYYFYEQMMRKFAAAPCINYCFKIRRMIPVLLLHNFQAAIQIVTNNQYLTGCKLIPDYDILKKIFFCKGGVNRVHDN
jgi:hypothetical protein